MKDVILKYGLYGAICICVLNLTGWYIGNDLSYSAQEIIGYAGMIVSLLFIFFGIKSFRDQKNDGKINFKQAMLIGLSISLITAFAFGILDVIYIEFINPDFVDDYYAHFVNEMKKSLPDEEFQLKLTELESQKALFSNVWMNFIIMSLTVFLIGFIITILSALILHRKS